MIRFEGDRQFPFPPSEVWAKFRDASFLVTCVPDSMPMGEATRDRAACRVRPGFAFIRGSLDVTLDVAGATEPTQVRLRLTSKGVGTSSEVESILDFTQREDGTHVHWVTEVRQLGGLLKAVPSALIKGAAQKVIDDVWRRVATKMGAGGA